MSVLLPSLPSEEETLKLHEQAYTLASSLVETFNEQFMKQFADSSEEDKPHAAVLGIACYLVLYGIMNQYPVGDPRRRHIKDGFGACVALNDEDYAAMEAAAFFDENPPQGRA